MPAPAGCAAQCAVGSLQLLDEGRVVGDAGDDGDIFKVFGGGAHHGGAADVDVFDEVAEGDAGLRGGFLKGIEIHDDHVDGLDAVRGDGGFVFGVAANVEQAAVDAGMQRLDAAVEHLRKAGEVADVFDVRVRLRAALARCRRWRSARRQSRPAPLAKSTSPVLSVTLNSARRICFSVPTDEVIAALLLGCFAIALRLFCDCVRLACSPSDLEGLTTE